MERIFCAIAEGKIPSAKVYEGEHVFAFMTLPQQHGTYLVVIPKQH